LTIEEWTADSLNETTGYPPGSVYYGSIRLRNQDIVRLDDLMTVGTPGSIL
jgi:hypothetical protein